MKHFFLDYACKWYHRLPWWVSSKESACPCRRLADVGLTSELGRAPGEGNGNPLQSSCPRNPVDREAWWATVHGITKESDTTEWLSNKRQSPSPRVLLQILLWPLPRPPFWETSVLPSNLFIRETASKANFCRSEIGPVEPVSRPQAVCCCGVRLSPSQSASPVKWGSSYYTTSTLKWL